LAILSMLDEEKLKRLKNRNKGEVHRAFPKFCAEYTYILYFKTLH